MRRRRNGVSDGGAEQFAPGAEEGREEGERGEGGGGPESVSESDIICQIEKSKHKAQSVRFAQ